jgi:hypothetical protein
MLVPALIHGGVPCALSQMVLKPTTQTESQNTIDYEAKLFISPDIEVKPGCEIEVFRLGRVTLFKSTGEPFVYASHQEILLKRHQRA